MSRRKSYIATVLLAAVALTTVIVACGGKSGASSTEANSLAEHSIGGSAPERATSILGHEPTGLAKDIVAKGTMVVANDSDYAPQSSVDPSTGEVTGFDVDVATRTAEILGLTVVWKHPEWATVPSGLQDGRYDVSIGSMASAVDGETDDPALADRGETLDFSEPYYYTPVQVFVREGGTQIEGPEDLAGKTVGVGAMSTCYLWLKANTSAVIKTYDTDVDAFPDLLNGTIDFAVAAGTIGQEAILGGMQMEFSGKPLYYEDLSMAVNKGETDWLALLNYAVRQMHTDGSLTRMSRKWYHGIDLSVKD